MPVNCSTAVHTAVVILAMLGGSAPCTRNVQKHKRTDSCRYPMIKI